MTRRPEVDRYSAPRPTGQTGNTLRLRDPADVLAAIPYLLGYHPADSMVVLGVSSQRYAFAVRADLPVAGAPDGQVRDEVEYLTRIMLRQPVDAVLLVGYGPEDRVRAITEELAPAYQRLGFDVREVLRAAAGRYWSYLCDNPTCCPSDGAPYDSRSSGVAAECTVAGRTALPDRASFEAQIASVVGADRISMGQAAARADQRLFDLLTHPPDEGGVHRVVLAAGREAVAAALRQQPTGQRLTDDEVAWLAILMTSVSVRDNAWALITGDPDELDRHRTLWMDVMRRCQPDLVAAPASLFAFAAWRCGDGALARLALERVIDLDPGYRMAGLLHDMIANGLPPSSMRDFPRFRRQSERRLRKHSKSRRAESRRG
jgi:hypothetical protein